MSRVRHEWTTNPRYLVHDEATYWTWLGTYTDRLRVPGAKISIYKDTRQWLGGSRNTLFTLLHDVGYRGANVFKTKTRLLSVQNAERLHGMLVRGNLGQNSEELTEAGIKAGAFVATSQIERGLQEDNEAMQLKLSRVNDVLVLLQSRETAWMAHERALVSKTEALERDLNMCARKNAEHARALEVYARNELDPDQIPPPPPYDPPMDVLLDVPPPLPPLMDEQFKDAEDAIVEARTISSNGSAKAVNNGKSGAISFQDQLKAAATTLRPSGAPETAAAERAVENKTSDLLFVLAKRLAAKRAASNMDDDSPSSWDDDDNDHIGLARTCRKCGLQALMMCVCEKALYCGKQCMKLDAGNHLHLCEAGIHSGVHVPCSINVGVTVDLKLSPAYMGRYRTEGSPHAYRVRVPGVRFGEKLILSDRSVYAFVAYANLSDHPLYLADNPVGGSQSGHGRIHKGTLTHQWSAFSVNTVDLPDVFYVVCDHHPYMGFQVRIDR